jgi:amino acid transporter
LKLQLAKLYNFTSLFSGFSVFFPGNFSAASFLSNYINCFVIIVLYVVLKFTIKSPFIKTDEMDFSEIEAIREERRMNEDQVVDKFTKRSFGRRIIEKIFDE